MGNANLLEVARGAIGERLDYELSKVVDNIADLKHQSGRSKKDNIDVITKAGQRKTEHQNVNTG